MRSESGDAAPRCQASRRPRPLERNDRRRSARPDRRSAANPARGHAVRCRTATATSSWARGTGDALSRNTSSSLPRTWRSVPAYRCGLRVGTGRGGNPADRHAQTLNGHRPQRGDRAVQTVAPSSINATEKRGASAVIGQQRGDVGEVADAGRRVGAAVHRPGDHPAHVGVDDGNPLAVGEARDGARGVACRCRAASTASRRRRAPRRRVRPRSRWRTRAAAWRVAGSRACPRPATRRRRWRPRWPTASASGPPSRARSARPARPASAAA